MPDHEISLDPARLDVNLVHRWLSEESYWAIGRTREVTDRAIAQSVCAGTYTPDGATVGFARAVTDRATFGWLCDVFVLEDHLGAGLAREMVRALMDASELATVRLWLLATADAHGVYAPLGFEALDGAGWMSTRRDASEAGTYAEPPA